jgi:hypothetical protein
MRWDAVDVAEIKGLAIELNPRESAVIMTTLPCYALQMYCKLQLNGDKPKRSLEKL